MRIECMAVLPILIIPLASPLAIIFRQTSALLIIRGTRSQALIQINGTHEFSFSNRFRYCDNISRPRLVENQCTLRSLRKPSHCALSQFFNALITLTRDVAEFCREMSLPQLLR